MAKILVRSHIRFGEDHTPSEVLIRNLIGNNTGNYIFLRSVIRTLMVSDDTEIETIRFNRNQVPKNEVEYYNRECSAFIIPLANAFRVSFMKELNRITDLVEQLDIPCVVVGVGLQAPIDQDNESFPFDEDVKRFMNAVLEKSSMVGIRGEATGHYLKKLGYTEEKDFTVIGCPSMYTYGDSLPQIRLPELTPASKVSYNMKPELPYAAYKFIRRESARFNNTVFISQVLWEIHNFFIGYPNSKAEDPLFPSDYPIHFDDCLMKGSKMVGFLEQPSWVEFLSGMDFNFGSRIHGNIISLLAGTPCYIIASDARVEELASYHNIPHVSYLDLKDDTSIFDLYEKADYTKFYQGHRERVDHYLDLYDKNHISHISRDMLNGKDTPFDRFVQSEKTFGVIRPFPELSLEEQELRMAEYAGAHFTRFDNYRDQKNAELTKLRESKNQIISEKNALIRDQKSEIRDLKKEIEWMKSSKFWKLREQVMKLKNR